MPAYSTLLIKNSAEPDAGWVRWFTGTRAACVLARKRVIEDAERMGYPVPTCRIRKAFKAERPGYTGDQQ